MNNKQLKVTTLKELREYKNGQIVELPPFAEGQPFVARIRRPSMMKLVEQGKIPNTLMEKANELYANGTAGIMDTDDKTMLAQAMELFDIIADSMLIQPTLQEIKDTVGSLTDDQYIYLFAYSQRGVKMLEGFRTVKEDNKSFGNGETVQSTSE